MVDQPTPDVSDADVVRVIHRNYPQAQHEAVSRSLGGVDDPRVKLAVLKLADRKLEEVADLFQGAKEDYRDVIAWAEYPKCMEDFRLFNRSVEVQKKVIDQDWEQYMRWLDAQ